MCAARRIERWLVRTISYNLRKNRALGEIETLVADHEADILCLQEVSTLALPSELGRLRLVHTTERNRLGLAIYADQERFRVRAVEAFQLKKSLHDRVLQPANERLLGARLHDASTGHDVIAASFHAAPLTALNSLRRHQISTALEQLQGLGRGVPVLMVGDYNYPVFQSRLDRHVRESGFDLTLSDRRTYLRYKMFRGHFDFATSVGMQVARVRTLAQGSSDHLPILVESAHAEAKLPVAA